MRKCRHRRACGNPSFSFQSFRLLYVSAASDDRAPSIDTSRSLQAIILYFFGIPAADGRFRESFR
jgi:hypothetical protein